MGANVKGSFTFTKMPPEKRPRVFKRNFNDSWEVDYLFIEENGKATCLVCGKTIAGKKVHSVKRHYMSLHSA